MNPMQPITDATKAAKSTANAASVAARELFFAGLGVVALLQEEAEKAFNQLVREGERAETGRPKTLTAAAVTEAEEDAQEVRAEVRAEVEKAGRKVEAFGAAFEERLADTITTTLRRMNVPTRDDIDSLKKSVDRLNRKTEALRAR